jgi:hypothetical protein
MLRLLSLPLIRASVAGAGFLFERGRRISAEMDEGRSLLQFDRLTRPGGRSKGRRRRLTGLGSRGSGRRGRLIG